MRTLIFLVLLVCSAKGDVLFSDAHAGYTCRFESDHKDVEATATQDEVIEIASDWAASFYEDESLEVADIEFRSDPLRFWLVRFTKAGTDELFYAVLLPDGTIVEPEEEKRI